jgi:hypothetical protein
MRTFKFIKMPLIASLLFIVTACGGAEDGGDSAVVLNGQVADGYLSGARVFLDRNGNRMPDPGEPSTESGAQGHFSLDIEQGEGNLYPVVAEVIAGKTIDEDQPNQYVAESYQLEAPAGKWAFISPLTTLVNHELSKDSNLSLQEAENRVLSQLGLSSNISLFEDYIQAPSNTGLGRAHRAARIIAGLMGSLQKEIELNLGVENAEGKRTAISLMISDQIVNNSDAIALGLVSSEEAIAIEETKTAVLQGINTTRLDADLLDRYVERMQVTNTIWDMTPPKVINQRPLVDGNASIDVVVSLIFDEEIDPASISQETIQIIGPTGPMPGTIAYDPTLKEVNFTTESYLRAFTTYEVYLAGIADKYGNSLEQPQSFNFTTIFDQRPPELPEF